MQTPTNSSFTPIPTSKHYDVHFNSNPVVTGIEILDESRAKVAFEEPFVKNDWTDDTQEGFESAELTVLYQRAREAFEFAAADAVKLHPAAAFTMGFEWAPGQKEVVVSGERV